MENKAFLLICEWQLQERTNCLLNNPVFSTKNHRIQGMFYPQNTVTCLSSNDESSYFILFPSVNLYKCKKGQETDTLASMLYSKTTSMNKILFNSNNSHK